MYKQKFGQKNQVQFNSVTDYYEFLGYLAKEDNTTKIVWECNDEQGAWGQEGRIQFYVAQPTRLHVMLHHTLGVGSIISRVNCNEFIEHLVTHHHFLSNGLQDRAKIRATIPIAHEADFDRGLTI